MSLFFLAHDTWKHSLRNKVCINQCLLNGSSNAWHTVFHGLDWTGLVKRGLVKHGLVKRRLVKHTKNNFINMIIHYSKNFSSENKRYHNS